MGFSFEKEAYIFKGFPLSKLHKNLKNLNKRQSLSILYLKSHYIMKK